MRLIDADKITVEQIQRATSVILSALAVRQLLDDQPTVVCKTCAVNDALTERIEELEGSQWIPCSDRLPEECENVLACADDEEVHIAFCDYTGWQDAHSYQYIHEVVAWQPLPEPYEEE